MTLYHFAIDYFAYGVKSTGEIHSRPRIYTPNTRIRRVTIASDARQVADAFKTRIDAQIRV